MQNYHPVREAQPPVLNKEASVYAAADQPVSTESCRERRDAWAEDGWSRIKVGEAVFR